MSNLLFLVAGWSDFFTDVSCKERVLAIAASIGLVRFDSALSTSSSLSSSSRMPTSERSDGICQNFYLVTP